MSGWVSASPGLTNGGVPGYVVKGMPNDSFGNPIAATRLAFALLLFTCFMKLNDVLPFIYFQF